MKISEMFGVKKAVWSFEVFPPKPTAELGGVRKTLEELAELRPDYVSVTCGAGGNGNRRTAEIAGMIGGEFGIEPDTSAKTPMEGLVNFHSINDTD